MSSQANNHLVLLSRVLLHANPTLELLERETPFATTFSPEEREKLLALANSHHVVVRALEVVRNLCAASYPEVAEWAANTIAAERARIDHALSYLEPICTTLEKEGCEVSVIKSLDHWPDLGSDLDLYANADPDRMIDAMRKHFKAELAPRSWGDRLAGKWNFIVPELPELVEIHVNRLGQTGEHVSWARSIPKNALSVQRGSYTFRVASSEDRLMISTLQRMYRHFYFRLCDIVDSAGLVERKVVDFPRLKRISESAGIWKGVATYLCIVSDYVKEYRGEGLELPSLVTEASQFGGSKVNFGKGFLRVPIVPQSVELYTAELAKMAFSGELRGTFRLSLLPYLAAMAALGQKLTGSDKGIW